MQVDAVQQGTGDAGAVALDLMDRAGAFVLGVSQVTARARLNKYEQNMMNRVKY